MCFTNLATNSTAIIRGYIYALVLNLTLKNTMTFRVALINSTLKIKTKYESRSRKYNVFDTLKIF